MDGPRREINGYVDTGTRLTTALCSVRFLTHRRKTDELELYHGKINIQTF